MQRAANFRCLGPREDDVTWQGVLGAPMWALAIGMLLGGLMLFGWGTLRELRAEELEQRPTAYAVRRAAFRCEVRRLRLSAQRMYCACAALLFVSAVLALAAKGLFWTALR